MLAKQAQDHHGSDSNNGLNAAPALHDSARPGRLLNVPCSSEYAAYMKPQNRSALHARMKRLTPLQKRLIGDWGRRRIGRFLRCMIFLIDNLQEGGTGWSWNQIALATWPRRRRAVLILCGRCTVPASCLWLPASLCDIKLLFQFL